jgi:hypothetical protein
MMLLRVKSSDWPGAASFKGGSVVGYVQENHTPKAIVLLDKDGSRPERLVAFQLEYIQPIGWREVHHNPMNLLGTVP